MVKKMADGLTNNPQNNEPTSPDALETAPRGTGRYRKNKPLSSRASIIVVIVVMAVILYIVLNLGETNTADNRQQIKVSNFAPADGNMEWEKYSAPEESEPITLASPMTVSREPEIVLRDDGTLGPPKDEPAQDNTASAKRNIKIVQKEPSEAVRQSRSKMLEAMYADTSVNLSAANANTSVQIGEGGEGGREDTDWEELIRGSNLFSDNNSGGGVAVAPSGLSGGAEDSNATAMAHQDRAAGFVSGNTGITGDIAGEYIQSTRRAPAGKYELKAGSVISGVMMGGINSDTPGIIVGQVSEHVYDSATGAYLLIPQGSRMVGKYDSHVVYGQNRVIVIWDRIVFPDGTSLNLEGMIGGDQSGYAGFKQKIDNHYSRMIGAALFASVFVAAGKIATEDDKNADGTKTEAANAVMETMADLGARIAERNLNVAPTLRILPGYRFSIICARDIAFAEPYYIP